MAYSDSDDYRRRKLRSSPPPILATTRNQSRGIHNLLRRSQYYYAIMFLFLMSWLIQFHYKDFIVLARFKLKDKAFENGWFLGSCGMRKKPLLFIQGETITAVWESNCEVEFELKYGITVARKGQKDYKKSKQDKVGWRNAKIKKVRMGGKRFVYQAILDELIGGRIYTYEVRDSIDDTRTPISRNTFIWNDATTSSTSTIHLAAVADNQFNVRIFHRVLKAIIKYAKSQKSTKEESFNFLPSILIHAGDQVQNPHNSQQWQTDFYDTLTSLLPIPFGQSTPILLARGNHDWDSTGVNALTGGSPPRLDWLHSRSLPPRKNHPGTFYSYSVHARCRILVLDSNLNAADQVEQEEWLEWEMNRVEWTRASLRIVVVHVPPFLEFWDKKAWDEGESKWSSFVRSRLTPLLSKYGTTLVLSGHSHAYSRGFLTAPLHSIYTSTTNSTTLSVANLDAASPRIQFRTPLPLNGTVYTIFGGAGGSFDVDRVDEWGFYEKSLIEQHHFGWITLNFNQSGDSNKVMRAYHMEIQKCSNGEISIRDELEWTAMGLEGQILDNFRIFTTACRLVDF